MMLIASCVALGVVAAGTDLAAARKACEAGQAADCVRVGLARLKGDGIAKNPAGDGVAEDDAKGAAWQARGIALHDEACKGGDADACYELAGRYEHGVSGVPKDGGRAAALYKQACEAGSDTACFALGQK